MLLLDDVLSELDGNRQNYLLNSLSDTQTIITCTGLDEFVKIDSSGQGLSCREGPGGGY